MTNITTGRITFYTGLPTKLFAGNICNGVMNFLDLNPSVRVLDA